MYLSVIVCVCMCVCAVCVCLCVQSKQEEADEVKRRFAGNTRSDHIALLNAYKVSYTTDICIILVHRYIVYMSAIVHRDGRRPETMATGRSTAGIISYPIIL